MNRDFARLYILLHCERIKADEKLNKPILEGDMIALSNKGDDFFENHALLLRIFNKLIKYKC